MKALVTGGASGFGAAITRALVTLPGADVIFTYCRSEENARALAAEFPNARAVKCDFSQDEDLAALIEGMAGWDLDVLVHNATVGGTNKRHFHKSDPADFARGFLANVMPVVRLTQSALSTFRRKKSGRIITVLTSYLINRPPVGMSEYVAAKAYLHSLSKSWAVENAAFGVTSNCVSPSIMVTNLTRDVDERVLEALVDNHPLKRLLTPAEAAIAVAFLAGPASVHINGVNLVLNAASDVV
jgi:3-oxoacyl-[acyl-carrier protein] reductase